MEISASHAGKITALTIAALAIAAVGSLGVHIAQEQKSAAPDSPQTQPAATSPVGETRAAIIFTGGHDTDPRDGGRPVVLVAAALNVPAEVFRKAFSGVTPARGGNQPEPAQVQRNKQALMSVLAPYGITNERLDEVSNYYRYVPQQGGLWKNTPASAHATVRNGLVTGITITSSGSGYSSAPKASISGMPSAKVEVTLSFSTDFAKNGAIQSVKIIPESTTQTATSNAPASRRQ